MNAVRLATAALVVALSLVYGGHFAGDAEIHLVFAKSASLGKLFEFNPGEPMAGVTSVGYMLLLGALNLAVPDWAMPLAAKLVGYVGWLGLVGAAYLLARALFDDERRALVVLALTGLMPGSAYNSLVGMENGVFGLAVLLLLLFVQRHTWLTQPGGAGVESRAALILGLLPWLRPEGFVVVGVALGFRWLKQRRASVLLWALPALLLGLGSLLFHHHYTGRWLPGSAIARLLAGTMTVGGVPLNSRVLERLAFYLPMTVSAVLGTREVLRSKDATWQLVAILTWLSLVLHSTLLGGPHVGRYLIYVMPLLALLAAKGIPWSPTIGRLPRATIVLGALWLGAVFAAEAVLRFRLGTPRELTNVMALIQSRAKYSDDVARLLGVTGTRPTRLAYVEVQARLFLDDRFVIRSLDGRVDTDWLRFVRGRTVDYVGYLRHREIDILMDLPGDAAAPTWSPARLQDLRSDEIRTEQGLAFTRPAGSHFVRVQVGGGGS